MVLVGGRYKVLYTYAMHAVFFESSTIFECFQ